MKNQRRKETERKKNGRTSDFRGQIKADCATNTIAEDLILTEADNC